MLYVVQLRGITQSRGCERILMVVVNRSMRSECCAVWVFRIRPRLLEEEKRVCEGTGASEGAPHLVSLSP